MNKETVKLLLYFQLDNYFGAAKIFFRGFWIKKKYGFPKPEQEWDEGVR